jgi:protein translocase SecG subunit
MNAAFTVLVVLIIVAAILLIAVVLLQNGKDGGLATNFTSANQTLGVRQTATILEKATWYLVAFILVLSIITVFVARGGTQRGANDAISTEILNQADTEEEAAAIFDSVLENRALPAQKNIVLANAGFGIQVLEKGKKSIEECIEIARESIDSGNALNTFKTFVELNS